MENNLVIGKIIKYIRTKANMTQQELAKKVNLGRSTLSDYEREKTDINFNMISKICDECNYDIAFINRNNNEVITVNNISRKI